MLALLSSMLNPKAADTVQLKDELDVCWCYTLTFRDAHPQTA